MEVRRNNIKCVYSWGRGFTGPPSPMIMSLSDLMGPPGTLRLEGRRARAMGPENIQTAGDLRSPVLQHLF